MRSEGDIKLYLKEARRLPPKGKDIGHLRCSTDEKSNKNWPSFFHNEFCGLVFGVGKKKENGTWDLEIPTKFLTISTVWANCGTH